VRPDPRVAGRLPRRGVDRLEDAATWLLMSLALTTLIVSAVVGVLVHATNMDAARVQAAERTAVDATALGDSPLLPTPDGFDPGMLAVEVPVRWTGPDGIVHVADAPVSGSTANGQPVSIWLDRTGRPVPAPASAADALVQGITVGGLLLALGAVVVGLGWLAAQRGIGRLNAGFWEREWARVGPQWTGHGRDARDRENGGF
jgi:hypothetical protein